MDDNKKYYVYQLRRVDQELPLYVGKGQGKRAKQHLCPSTLNEKSYKANALRKAKQEGVEVVIEMLEVGLTEQEAFEYEKFFISAYGRKNIGTGCLTNLTEGGEGASGMVVSESTRRRLSERHKGVPQPKELVEKRAEANRGQKRTQEQRKRMSESAKKKPTMSEETKRLIRQNAKRGQDSVSAKLCDEDIIHMYILFHEGMTQQEVANIFNVDRSNAGYIKRGKQWGHLYHYYTGELQ